MTQKDQIKLLEAGYRIIRRDYTRMVLKQKTTHRYDWHNASAVFTTKVALNELASQQLESKMVIEDGFNSDLS